MSHGDAKRFGADGPKRGAFQNGPDPRRNAGGRPALAKAWDAATNGKTMAEVTADLLKLVYDRAMQGPEPNHFGDPNDPDWRFAVQKAIEYSAGKPKETVEVIGAGESERKRFDWKAIPLERRRELLAAIKELRALAVDEPTEPAEDNAGPTEH